MALTSNPGKDPPSPTLQETLDLSVEARYELYERQLRAIAQKAAQKSKKAQKPVEKPLRVLMISESVPPQINGIARRTQHYIDGLRELGHDVTEMTPEQRDTCWRYRNLWQLGNWFIIAKPSAVWRAVSHPAHEEFDVVHGVMPLNLSVFLFFLAFRIKALLFDLASGLGLCRKGRRRPHLVVSWHCNLYDYFPEFCPGLPTSVRRFFWLLALAPIHALCLMSDRVLTPTCATEPDVRSMFVEEGRGLAATGIESNKFSPLRFFTPHGRSWAERKAKTLQALAASHDCSEGAPQPQLLLYVGRVSKEKCIDEIVWALQQPALKGRVALWVIGDGAYRDVLETRCRKKALPVEFWGFRRGEELWAAYTAADCFVTASNTETWGQTVSEAIASGCRVCVPRQSAFHEAFGSIIDTMWTPGNRDEMVETIVAALDEEAEVGRVVPSNVDSSKVGPSEWAGLAKLAHKTVQASKLIDWTDASQNLANEYCAAYRRETWWWTLPALPMLLIVLAVMGAMRLMASAQRFLLDSCGLTRQTTVEIVCGTCMVMMLVLLACFGGCARESYNMVHVFFQSM